ncbi:hypothetical protein N9N67_05920 [Bacteriovoracaceae bacterium]|nr:hypothetical protein [Bacteriovoracaceae bacterium]
MTRITLFLSFLLYANFASAGIIDFDCIDQCKGMTFNKETGELELKDYSPEDQAVKIRITFGLFEGGYYYKNKFKLLPYVKPFIFKTDVLSKANQNIYKYYNRGSRRKLVGKFTNNDGLWFATKRSSCKLEYIKAKVYFAECKNHIGITLSGYFKKL